MIHTIIYIHILHNTLIHTYNVHATLYIILCTYTYNRRTHRHMSIHIHTWYIIHTYIYLYYINVIDTHIQHITSLIHVYTHILTHTTILYTLHCTYILIYSYTTHAYSTHIYTHTVHIRPYKLYHTYIDSSILDSTPLYMHMLI